MKFAQVFQQVLARSGAGCGAGPEGFKRLMRRLGNPQYAYRAIHIAGTNGKGSVCSLCAAALQADGRRTGLFISPHLFSVQERISIDGKPISKKDFARLCLQVLAAEKETLNFFEIITAACLLYFREQGVQYAVLETGLGGRRDPTRVCLPAACAITSVGLDHCQLLGSTLRRIAYEKAGIIKAGVAVFCPEMAAPALAEIRRQALLLKAPLHLIKEKEVFSLAKTDWPRGRLLLRKGGALWPLHLMGEKQPQNAGLVYALCRFLGVSEGALKKAFKQIYVPCRFEVCTCKNKRIIFDGAHNPQAVQGLMDFWRTSPWAADAALVCGFMKDKDYHTMLRLLQGHFKAVYITVPPSPRAASLAEVKKALETLQKQNGRNTPLAQHVFFYASPARALQAAQKTWPSVLVSGSFYLAGYLRARKGLTEKSDCD